MDLTYPLEVGKLRQASLILETTFANWTVFFCLTIAEKRYQQKKQDIANIENLSYKLLD